VILGQARAWRLQQVSLLLILLLVGMSL